MALKRALIVDDSRSMRQMVSFTLQQAGFDLVEAENGKDALDKLRGQKFGVIITDLNMPVLDGIGFIRQARQTAEARFLPILILTTESQAEKKLEAKAAGATGWIVKPFEPDKLMQTIGKVMG
jgi:two-component system chemotaxis response regulator CheY